jgi:hypothetical protein
MPDLHPEILTGRQADVLTEVAPFATSEGFYLSGGTAVALHLGHRRSDDFDWFAPDDFQPLLLASRLRSQVGEVQVLSQDRGTLHAAASAVKLSFLHYPYPLLQPPVPWPEYGFGMASPRDLACTKLAAVVSRGARKDFVDLYALGRSGLTLEEMVGAYRERYEVMDVGHVLFSLSYFAEAEPQDMPEMLWPVDWEEIKTTIRGWVAKV